MRYGRRIETRRTLTAASAEGVDDVSLEVVLFLVVALLAGGLTMGGITLVYFLDKWRSDPEVPPVGADRAASPFDRAA